MMNAVKAVLTLFVCCLHSLPAQSNDLQWQPLSQFNEREGDVALALAFDQQNFLWIGSHNGLYRFDGREARLFRHESNRPNGLGGNAVRTITVLPNQSLLLGISDAGLDQFHRSHFTAQHWRHSPNNPASLTHDTVYKIALDSAANFWLATGEGISLISSDGQTVRRFTSKNNGLGNDMITAIAVDANDTVWAGTYGAGLYFKPADSAQFLPVQAERERLQHRYVTVISPAENGQIWVGTSNGLLRLDANGKMEKFYRASSDRERRALDIVSSVRVDQREGIWIGTWDNGLFHLNNDGSLVGVNTPKAAQRIVDLQFDQSGNIWIATWGAGVWFAPLQPLPVYEWKIEDANSGLIRAEFPFALSTAQGIWLGSRGSGLLFSKGTQTAFSPVTLVPNEKVFYSMLIDSNKTIWLGSVEGVWRVDKDATAQRVLFVSDQAKSPQNFHQLIESPQHVWVASRAGTLHRINKQDNKVEAISIGVTNGAINSMSALNETTFAIADNERLYGCRFDLNIDCQAITMANRAGEDLGAVHVNQLFYENTNQWLVATTTGIFSWSGQAHDRAREMLTIKEGLNDGNVLGLQRDNRQRFWLTTRSGIIVWDRQQQSLQNIVKEDGVTLRNFMNSATVSAQQMMFVGANGVLAIEKNINVPVRKNAQIWLRLEDREGNLLSTHEQQTMQLALGVPVRVAFGLPEYKSNHLQRHFYRFGTNSAWIDLGQRREFDLDNLAAGDHVLQVKVVAATGAVSELTPIKIRVLPPFWRDRAVQTIAAFTFALLVIILVNVYVRRLQRRNAHLLTLQSEKDAALLVAATNADNLQTVNQQLLKLAQQQDSLLETERKHIAHELHDEFGQSLTAAKINLRLLSREHQNHDQRWHETEFIINDLINRVRQLSFDLRPPLLDDVGVEGALQALVTNVAQRSEIIIQFDLVGELKSLDDAIAVVIYRVIQEALTNIERHAGACTVQIRLTRTPAQVHLVIADNGRGFALDQVSLISQGLRGIKERVALHLGQCNISAQVDVGCTIDIHLPLGT